MIPVTDASGFEGVPKGSMQTRFRTVFGLLPVPETSPKGPRKALPRPRRGHPEVAKGRPEVLGRSQEGSGKVIRPLQKFAAEDSLGINKASTMGALGNLEIWPQIGWAEIGP